MMLDERFPFPFVERRLVETLQIQKDRAERHDHHQQPLIIPERVDRSGEIEPGRAVVAQAVRGQQRKRQQNGINQLLQLCV